MANGAFLGGFAEGSLAKSKQLLAEDELKQQGEFRDRSLGIAEDRLGIDREDLKLRQRRQKLEELAARDKGVSNTLKEHEANIKNSTEAVFGLIKEYRSAGNSPEEIRKAVKPIIDGIQRSRAVAGVSADLALNRIDAELAKPPPTAIAAGEGAEKGTATAAAKIAEARALAKAGLGPDEKLAGFKDKKQKVDAENSLRDDYVSQSKSFVEVRNAYDRILSIGDTGAGDVALIFSFMKTLDPGSTVREGEFATAQQTAGIPERVVTIYNQALRGERLSPGQRQEFKKQAENLYKAAKKGHDQMSKAFRGVAERQGLDTRNVIIDFSAAGEPKSVSGVTSSGVTFQVNP